MAILIRLKGQIYKAPNKIVVGRGAPFSVLNAEWEIARAHFVLKSMKGKIYIMDLGSETGTSVNGKKLKPDQYVLVSSKDIVSFATSSMTLLDEVSKKDEVIEIKRTSIDGSRSLLHAFGAEVIGLGVFIFHYYRSFNFLMLGLLSVGLFVVIRILRNLLEKRFPSMTMKEVFMSSEGFTVHFCDGENMSFKMTDIKAWGLSNDRKILQLMAYKQDFRMKTSGEFDDLTKYLYSHLKAKKIKKTTSIPLMAIAVMMSFVAYASNGSLGWNFPLIAGGFLFLLCVAMMLNKELLKTLPFSMGKVHSRKKQMLFLMFLACYSSFQVYDTYKTKKNLAQVKQCTPNFPKACQQVDFSQLDVKRDKLSKITLETACQSSNKSACAYLPSRSIASEPEKP